MLNVQYGWQFDVTTKGWQFVEFMQVRPFMGRIGQGLFVVLFLGFVILLATCVCIYVWVYLSVQNNKFDYVWPLRLARLFGATFFEALDVMAVSLMTTAIDCRYYGWPSDMLLHSYEFPASECLAFPAVIYFALAVVGIVVFVSLAGFNKLAQMDLNPATSSWDAYAHPGIELCVLAIKMLIVLASVLLGDYRHLAVFWLLCCTLLCYCFWRWEPMVVPWVNYVRMGSFTAVLYVACLFMALQFPPDSVQVPPSALLAAARSGASLGTADASYTNYVRILQIALVGVVPAALVGALAAYLRLRYFRVTILNKLKSATVGMKARHIHTFSSSLEVEVTARCCRVWVDAETLEPEAVALADRVLKLGLASLPNDPFMIIWYTSFLVNVQGSFQSGYTQLQVALKLGPSFIDAYAIFSHEQTHARQSASGRGGPRDALADIEFQKSYRLVLHAHKDALLALRVFWQLAQHSVVKYEQLAQAARRINKSILAAERTYRVVLQRHSDQPQLLRLYAKFLDRVKHDPWGAARWTAEAEKLEMANDDSRHSNVLGLDEKGGDISAGHISRFAIGDNGEERALCVLNANGIIAMSNETLRDMFGYAKAELKGRSIAVLMPPAFAEQAMHEIKSFVVAGHGVVVIRSSTFVAVHKDRHMFSARIAVVRISGIGEDSTFLAALEVIPPRPDTATVWVLTSGQVLSADDRFRDWFGHSLADIDGVSTARLTPDSKELDGVLKAARHALLLAKLSALDAQASEEQEEANAAADTMALLAESSKPAQQAESIAQALAAAAVVQPDFLQPAECTEWLLQGVRMHHKYTESVEVDVIVTNTSATMFPMHVLTLRRSGADAATPMPHMLVTNAARAVMHVSEAFAALLGTTAKALMANSSHHALEAFMVQPFGLLHRVGLSASLPSVQPPAYSCRSGLSVLMPIADSRIPDAVPVKMQMKKRTGLDEGYFVCTLQPRTWEQALDERSLRLVVDEAGVIRAAGDSPATLFGFDPAILRGRDASSCVDVLQGEGVPLHLLTELSARSVDAPGSFWRVGVAGPADQGARALDANRTPKTVAAVMTVTRVANVADQTSSTRAEATLDDEQLLVAPASLTRPGYELRLWRADMVTSVVEVDGNGVVVEGEAMLQALYPPGAALGVGAAQMLGEHIRDFLPLGGHKHTELFDEGTFPPVPVKGAAAATALELSSRKKSNIKSLHSHESRRVGPPVLLHGRNRLDGLDMRLTVQIVRKGGSGAYLVLHPYAPSCGRTDLLQHLMHNDAMCTVDAEAPRKLRHSSIVESDVQVPAASTPRGSLMKRSSRLSTVAPPSAEPAALAPQPSAVRFDQVQELTASSASRGAVAVAKQASVSKWLEADGPTAPLATHPLVRDIYHAREHDRESPDEQGLDPASRTQLSFIIPEDGDGADVHVIVHDGTERHTAPGDVGSGHYDPAATAAATAAAAAAFAATAAKSEDNSSQMDDAANTHDDGENDYRRGQRLRKLNRMFNSDVATRHARRLKWHALLMMALLAVAAALIFVAMSILTTQQIQSVEDLDNMGAASRRTIRTVTKALVLGMYYQPYPNPFLVPELPLLSGTALDIASIQANTNADVVTMAEFNRGVYEGYSVKRRLPVDFGVRALWETPSLPEVNVVLLPTTEETMDPNTYVPVNGTWVEYTTTTMVSLYEGVSKAASMVRDILANGAWYNSTLQPGQNWVDWDSVRYLRNNVEATYSDAYITSMDGFAQVVIQSAEQVNTVQLIIMVAEGLVLALVLFGYMWFLCSKVEANRYNVFTVFTSVPLHTVRALANARIDLGEGDSDDEVDALTAAAAAAARTDALPPTDGKAGAAAAAAAVAAGGGKARQRKATAGAVGSDGQLSSGLQGVCARLASVVLFWRGTAARVGGTAADAAQEQRKLMRTRRGVWWLVWPFAAWGAVIVLMDGLAYQRLGSVHGPMMTFNIVNSVQSKFWRIFHAITVMHYETDLAASAREVQDCLTAAQLDYTCMLHGHDGVPEQTSPHYTLVTSGISTEPGPGQEMLYDFVGCLDTTGLSCVPPTDPVYIYVNYGLNALVQRFFEVTENMIKLLESGVMPTNQGPEFAFVWKIRDMLTGGASRLVDAYKGQVQDVYVATRTLHLAAFVLSLVFVVVYLLLMLWPYLREVSSERRRVTELLTQLPAEVDVEALVRRALVGANHTAAAQGRAAVGKSASSSADAALLPAEQHYSSAADNGGPAMTLKGGAGGASRASFKESAISSDSQVALIAAGGTASSPAARPSIQERGGRSTFSRMRTSGTDGATKGTGV